MIGLWTGMIIVGCCLGWFCWIVVFLDITKGELLFAWCVWFCGDGFEYVWWWVLISENWDSMGGVWTIEWRRDMKFPGLAEDWWVLLLLGFGLWFEWCVYRSMVTVTQVVEDSGSRSRTNRSKNKISR